MERITHRDHTQRIIGALITEALIEKDLVEMTTEQLTDLYAEHFGDYYSVTNETEEEEEEEEGTAHFHCGTMSYLAFKNEHDYDEGKDMITGYFQAFWNSTTNPIGGGEHICFPQKISFPRSTILWINWEANN